MERSREQWDIVVVGAGIIGLATAMRLLEREPGLRLLVLDKEADVAAHQSGHNSGVIHRGIYYAPGSLKAKLCVEGAGRLVEFCDSHGIPYRLCGKLIVALNESELPALRELQRRAEANGVPGCRWLDGPGIREVEPHAEGIAALHSPMTGIVDYRQVARAYADEVIRRGGEVRLATPVLGIKERESGAEVTTARGAIHTQRVVTCAGLHSDRLAVMAGAGPTLGLRIVPFRGDYYALRDERRSLVRGLVYPVPDPRFPFLGVHFTPRMDGSAWAGPNAVLAFAREGYRLRTISARDLLGTLGYVGFWRLALRYWRVGMAEMWRDVSKVAYASALRRYIPEIRADDLLPAPAGVRAQAVSADGTLVDDFVIVGSGAATHVVNAPSPAATSALAIADVVIDRSFQDSSAAQV